MNKKKQPTITHDEWIKGLLPSIDERPPNSFTIEEAISATNMKRSTVIRNINLAIDEGRLVRHRIILNGRFGWAFTEAKK